MGKVGIWRGRRQWCDRYDGNVLCVGTESGGIHGYSPYHYRHSLATTWCILAGWSWRGLLDQYLVDAVRLRSRASSCNLDYC